MTSQFLCLFKIFRFLFSWHPTYPRKTQNFAPCENFPLYGICAYIYMHIYNHASLVVQYMYTFTCAFTASQMMTLVRHLPLFIGDLVDHDDDHWECFLLLWDIAVLCAPLK